MVLHDRDMATEDRSLAAYVLEQKIADQLREHSEQKKQVSEARYDVEGENLRTNSWTRSAKGYHTKESIMEFKVEEGSYSEAPRYETRPKPMAQMARDYHDSIQYRDLPDEYGRLMATHYILGLPRPTPWPRPSTNLGQLLGSA
jgi:hypothetical protein